MNTKKFALIGHPLGHTMSPPIHKRLFELSGTSADYEAVDIAPERLAEKFDEILKYVGVNVTIPHKISVIPFLNSLDPGAARYGSVNVIDCKSKTGYNTDVIGFTRAIAGLGSKLSGKTLLLGCGGAGRMMAIETAFCGGDLTIAVRESDLDAARALAGEIHDKTGRGANVAKISDIGGSDKFDLLLNATPVGMFPNVNACPVSEAVVKNAACVFDAVYNPRETMLVKCARDAGVPAGGGMAMLVFQAAAAHEIWENARYSDEDLKKLISDISDLL